MSLKPLGDRVLIKVQEAETKTASGILIPETAKEKTQTGEVVAVGTDKDMIQVEVGQKVMYDQYSGTKVKVGTVEHLIVRMQDILAIVD